MVSENLWMGGVPPVGGQVVKYFDGLVLAAAEYQVADDYPGVEVLLAPMHDDGSPMTKEDVGTALRATSWVVKRLRDGQKVLVTCRMGLNRSGLVCAMSLCCGSATPEADEAIAAVRAARGPDALGNQDFTSLIRRFCRLRSRFFQKSI